MSDSSITRRHFLSAAAAVGAWATAGGRLPTGAAFAPSFVNCDAQFFAQLKPLLSKNPQLRVTLFLTADELAHAPTSRQIEVGFRPNHPNIPQNYAKWLQRHKKPLFATAEQGALWSKLAELCARHEILLASWDGLSERFEAGNPRPLFDGRAADLDRLLTQIKRTAFLESGLSKQLIPLATPTPDAATIPFR